MFSMTKSAIISFYSIIHFCIPMRSMCAYDSIIFVWDYYIFAAKEHRINVCFREKLFFISFRLLWFRWLRFFFFLLLRSILWFHSFLFSPCQYLSCWRRMYWVYKRFVLVLFSLPLPIVSERDTQGPSEHNCIYEFFSPPILRSVLIFHAYVCM